MKIVTITDIAKSLRKSPKSLRVKARRVEKQLPPTVNKKDWAWEASKAPQAKKVLAS